MDDLRITLVQSNIHWENVEANLDYFEQLLDRVQEGTDLIILPEMFTTGFTLNGVVLAEPMDGPTTAWMRRIARRLGAAITGSIIVRDKGALYNRLLWVTPDGQILHYDKRHLFRFAHEDSVYTVGKEKMTAELNGWKIRPFICYDLRFPVWSANMGLEYDLGIYVANWPAARSAHWKALLPARAIENQVYIAGVNRVGIDGNSLEYSGDSVIIDPQGRTIFEGRDTARTATCTLSATELQQYRQRFPAWRDMQDTVD